MSNIQASSEAYIIKNSLLHWNLIYCWSKEKTSKMAVGGSYHTTESLTKSSFTQSSIHLVILKMLRSLYYELHYNNNIAFQSQASWGRVELKPTKSTKSRFSHFQFILWTPLILILTVRNSYLLGAFVLLQDSITNKNWNKRFLGTTSMNAKMNRYHVTQGMKDI